MNNNKCILTVDETKKEILLKGLDDEIMSIEYSGDVELTELITKLAERIDVGKHVDLEKQDIKDEDDEKLIFVIETIQDIFSKYSESIEDKGEEHLIDVDVVEDDEIPF